jgi:signal transduction histidine kinase
MNPAAETVFKTTISKSQGKNLREIVQSEELAELAENGTTVNEWLTSDDKTFMPRIEAVRDSSGSIEGWVLALRDVTHFKKLNRNQSEFMRIVSHDLRSPLTSMQGFASMLELGLVGELNEKQKHFVSKILAGITQMTALVDNIQDAGRYDPETGFYDLSRSQVDLGEMVQRIIDNHLVPAEKALSISVAVSDDVPIINADANMLERAIINLFDNAIKYTPDGGKIEVGVKRSENDVVIGVKDSGLGISKDAQLHLFERHVRIAREEHKKIKGSGLGLFIVRSVAQRHGGDAWVESKEGEGSTFFVGIPLEGPNLITSGKN